MPQRYVVSRADARTPLGRWLQRRLALPWEEVRGLVHAQRVWIQGRVCRDLNFPVQSGQQVEIRGPRKSGPDGRSRSERPADGPSLAAGALRHLDDQLIVVEKPPGLTTMRHAQDVAEHGARARKYLPPTLADLLPALIAQTRPGKPGLVRAVHRLDKETSGLVAFARTVEAERHLGQQFRAHSVERTYLALCRGRARAGRIESWLIDDRGDARRGSRPVAGQGQHAVTHVQVVENLGDFTLVECRLETGRTHQVRIHLGEAGTPLCGERVYDRPIHGRPVPDASGAPRVALHAATLALDHPVTGKRLRWSSPLPDDLEQLLRRLRQQRKADS